MIVQSIRGYFVRTGTSVYVTCSPKSVRVLRRWRSSSSSSSWSIDPISGIVVSCDDDRNSCENENNKPKYQSILGVEIHAQLDIPTKLFSSAVVPGTLVAETPSTDTVLPAQQQQQQQQRQTQQRPPNTSVHPYDAAVPGFLPSLSAQAVQAAVVAARLLNCSIRTSSRFERKHYAYADLPHSYQITQQRWPIAIDGNVEVSYDTTFAQHGGGSGGKKGGKTIKRKKGNSQQSTLSCRINRIQLEQDSGKTTHVLNNETGFRESRVDLNRAGQALIEIVSEPDLRTPQQAAALVEHLRQLFKHVGVCNGRMEEGNLRCDLNVNLQDLRTGQRSARVEVKNLNSLRQIMEAATYELHRHADEWPTDEETRTWDVSTSRTELIRRKDKAEDYRFMPEPDLPPVLLNASVLNGLELEDFLTERIPELPAQAVERFMTEYGLSEYQANVITGDPPAIPFLDEAIHVAQGLLENDNQKQQQRAAVEMTTNFLINDLFGIVKEHSPNEAEASVSESFVSPKQLGEIMAMILNGKISTTMAKNLLLVLYTTERGGKPVQVAADQGWELVTDPEELRTLCEQVIREHPDELVTYQKGGKYEIKIYKFFTGKAMAASKGTAEPERLKDILQQVLEDHCS